MGNIQGLNTPETPVKRLVYITRFLCKSLKNIQSRPDLKSDVGSNLPGVRIPRYPPHLKASTSSGLFPFWHWVTRG
jgi:hypothetical protein